MSSRLPLTLLSLEQLIESEERLIVLDCYAEWCGPCKRLAPFIENLETAYNNSIVVLKADVDECDDIAAKFGVQSLPTILFFKHGRLIDQNIGASQEAISQKINLYWK